MKKIFIYSILFLLSFCSISISQTNDTVNISNDLDLKNRFSLQFAVGGNLYLQSLEGLIFALNYHFTDRYALRFGVGILASANNKTTNSDEYLNNKENITFISSFLIYPRPTTEFKFYYGAGPRLSYAHNLKNDDDETTSWAVGLQLNLGVEWFAFRDLSIFGEYTAYGTFGRTHSRTYSCSGSICGYTYNNSTDWYFDGTTSRIGLSIYF